MALLYDSVPLFQQYGRTISNVCRMCEGGGVMI